MGEVVQVGPFAVALCLLSRSGGVWVSASLKSLDWVGHTGRVRLGSLVKLGLGGLGQWVWECGCGCGFVGARVVVLLVLLVVAC